MVFTSILSFELPALVMMDQDIENSQTIAHSPGPQEENKKRHDEAECQRRESCLQGNSRRRMKWVVVLVAGLVLVALAQADGEIWEEDEHEVLIRSERGAKSRDPCRYVKGAWSDCDPKTNMRSRILNLKKGDPATCEQTKTIQKKCKKACRYEKGSWSECTSQNQMTRTDSLKANSDPSCEQSRQITKKCKNKGSKNSKGGRRNRQ